MQAEEINGCPTTQVSASSTTCAATTPPSCLAEFNCVDENNGGNPATPSLVATAASR
jgi:hypothetical protein